MRVAVIGTGAVGGYFGARLAAAGHETVFIARGANLAVLKSSGLRIDSFEDNLHVANALFTDKPAQAGAVDLILFCVKSYDTDGAALAITPLAAAATRILSLQNGIDNPARLARVFGADRVLAGIAYIGAQLLQPGVVSHSSGGRIVIGQLDGAVSENTAAIAQAFTAANVPCEVSTQIRRAQWRKLLWNAPFCALSCLTRATVRDILECGPLRKLAIDCMAEVIAAAACDHVILPAEAVNETVEFSLTLGAFKPSMLQDLEAGKPLEFEAFNGIVVALLRSAGQEAPVNEVFYGTLRYLDKKLREKRTSG